MLKNLKAWITEYYLFIITIIIVIAMLVCIGLTFYCSITFGDLPVTEVPAWALPFII